MQRQGKEPKINGEMQQLAAIASTFPKQKLQLVSQRAA